MSGLRKGLEGNMDKLDKLLTWLVKDLIRIFREMKELGILNGWPLRVGLLFLLLVIIIIAD
jgi:hypothetical protein